MGSVYVYDTPVRDILLAGSTPIGAGPLVLTEFTVFMDNWIMHLLFLVSGIGAAFSLRKRSGPQFLGERCNRLLLPLFLGTVLIVSIQSWLRALSFGRFSGGYKEGRMLGIAGDLSFPLYILHYAPLTAATYLLLNTGLSFRTRWFIAVVASWSFVAVFTFLSRFIPPVRDFFSIRQTSVKTP
jgi:hypothetical protein